MALQITVWKIENFFATQILREINFGKYQVSKSVNHNFTNLEALNFGRMDFI